MGQADGLHQGLAQGHVIAVEPFEAVHAHVGVRLWRMLRRLHQGADALQGAEDRFEGVVVAGRVGLKEDGFGAEGQRLAQRQAWAQALGLRLG